MTRKCHNHRPTHRTMRKRHKTARTQCKVTSSLFLSKMIAKLERTPKTTPQKQRPNTKTHTIWASMPENLSWGFENNTGADKPVHLCRLISANVIRFFESITRILTCYKQNFYFIRYFLYLLLC